MPANVVLLIDSLHCGGAQRQLCYLAKELSRLGHSVSVCNYHPQYDFFRPYLAENGIKVIDLSERPKFTLPLRLSRVTRELRADWVVSFSSSANKVMVLARILGGNFKACCGERSCSAGPRLSFRETVQRLHYFWSTLIVANSNYQLQILKRSFPIRSKRVVCIRNCVDDKFFLVGANRFATQRHAPEVSFVAVGQLYPLKNLHGLVQAVIKLKQQGSPGFKIKWAGREGENASSYFSEQKRIIEENGLADVFDFIGQCDDVPSFLRDGSALIHPSLIEGFPNAICEAFATGLPVLAGDISDAPDLVNEERGYLFDPKDSDSICLAMSRFLRLSATEKQNMGREARKFAKEHFSAQDFGRTFSNVLGIDSVSQS
ncbi:MAG: glycosyltransferase family 4 protein [Pirellulaceae bacterium]